MRWAGEHKAFLLHLCREVLGPTLIRWKLPRAHPSSVTTSAKSAPVPQSRGISWGLSPSGFLPFDLQSHPCVALEETACELQPNFPILGGSQKCKPDLSRLLATEGNIL